MRSTPAHYLLHALLTLAFVAAQWLCVCRAMAARPPVQTPHVPACCQTDAAPATGHPARTGERDARHCPHCGNPLGQNAVVTPPAGVAADVVLAPFAASPPPLYATAGLIAGPTLTAARAGPLATAPVSDLLRVKCALRL